MVKEAAEIGVLHKAGGALDRVHARVPEFLVLRLNCGQGSR